MIDRQIDGQSAHRLLNYPIIQLPNSRLQHHRVVQRDLLHHTQRWLDDFREFLPHRLAPAAPLHARACRTRRRARRNSTPFAAIDRPSLRRSPPPPTRARRTPAATARQSARPACAAPARRADASARSRRSSRPPTESPYVTAGHQEQTARHLAANVFALSATSARAPAASASGADPNSRRRSIRSSRTPRSTSSR